MDRSHSSVYGTAVNNIVEITRQEWKKTHKDFKTITSDGVYMVLTETGMKRVVFVN